MKETTPLKRFMCYVWHIDPIYNGAHRVEKTIMTATFFPAVIYPTFNFNDWYIFDFLCNYQSAPTLLCHFSGHPENDPDFEVAIQKFPSVDRVEKPWDNKRGGKCNAHMVVPKKHRYDNTQEKIPIVRGDSIAKTQNCNMSGKVQISCAIIPTGLNKCREVISNVVADFSALISDNILLSSKFCFCWRYMHSCIASVYSRNIIPGDLRPNNGLIFFGTQWEVWLPW